MQIRARATRVMNGSYSKAWTDREINELVAPGCNRCTTGAPCGGRSARRLQRGRDAAWETILHARSQRGAVGAHGLALARQPDEPGEHVELDARQDLALAHFLVGVPAEDVDREVAGPRPDP